MDIFGDSSEEENGEDKSLKEYLFTWQAIVLICACIFFILYRGRIGMVSMDKAMAYFIGAILFIYIGTTINTEFKQRTPKLIASDYHTTIDPIDYTTVGNYGMIRAGGVRAGQIYFPGNEGVVIAPKTCWNWRGKSVDVAARIESKPIEALPTTIRNEILARNWKPPYRMGYADEDIYMAIPNLIFLVSELDQTNKENTFLRKIADLKFDDIEKVVAAMSRMSERSRGDTLGKLKRAFIDEEK